jgi:hypothetical protein
MKGGEIFISHYSKRVREADAFRRLVIHHTINPSGKEVLRTFLSSDASSIPSGVPWISRIFNSLDACSHFAGLIVQKEDFENRWIPFEAAYIMGRKVDMNVFVFGGITMSDCPPPLSFLQLIDTGNTERVWNALQAMGVNENPESIRDFAHLFRQCSHFQSPSKECDARRFTP